MVLGMTVLGSVWGCVAAGLVGAFTIFRARSGEDWGSAFGVMYSAFCCGVPLGALAGFLAAIRVLQSEVEDWSPIVWIGVCLGVGLGLFISFSRLMGQLQTVATQLLLTAIVTAATGAVGGILAAAGEQIWVRATRGSYRLVAAVLGLLLALVPALCVLGVAALCFAGRITPLELALSILIGVPILCGLALWARFENATRSSTHAFDRYRSRHR
jgi:hypothetical protein